MTSPTPAARQLAESLSSCAIEERSAAHSALRAARIAEEARLIDRLAQAAGISTDTLAARAGIREAA